MRDELFDRGYQDGRAAMNDGIDRLLARAAAFLDKTGRAMHRVEWAAPWKSADKSKRTGVA